MLRQQLPVYSPVTWRAIMDGLVAATSPSGDGGLRIRLCDALKARYGARDVLLTDSGTSALRLAIQGALLEGEGPVGLPGYGCYDLATAAEGAGARVVLYDIDPRDLGPEAESLERLRSAGPVAVVAAHLFGYPVDVPAVRRALPGVVMIEDAAQGAGGLLEGRPLGALGSVSVLSFGRGKGMTGGGGGALLALDEIGARIVDGARARIGDGAAGRGIRPLLALAAQLMLGRPALYGLPASVPFLHLGQTIYHPPRRPQGVTAASLGVLQRTMPEADREVDVRREHAARLERAARGSDRVRTVEPPSGSRPGCLRLPVVMHSGGVPGTIPPEIRRLGVTGMYPTTLASLPSLAPFRADAGAPLPNAEALVASLVALPTHRLVSEGDLRSLEEWLRSG